MRVGSSHSRILPGLFVTFEGVDGAGKSTQIALLRAALKHDNVPVCTTREPGGDAFGEAIRSLVLHTEMSARAELLLFLAARAQNVERVILPHLEQPGVVLCDRFVDSSIAYQGHARGLGRDVVADLNAFAIDALMPDLTFLLDLSPDIGLTRQTDRNRMEEENIAFYRRVREGFLSEARNDPTRFCVLDATLPVDALHDEILARTRLALLTLQKRSETER